MHHLLRHIRSNAVAYVALFVALGGTGYAALHLPTNSVGNRQIQNGAITPVKIDRHLITGSCGRGPRSDANGKLLAGEGSPKSGMTGPDSLGQYLVTWQARRSLGAPRRPALVPGDVNHAELRGSPDADRPEVLTTEPMSTTPKAAGGTAVLGSLLC